MYLEIENSLLSIPFLFGSIISFFSGIKELSKIKELKNDSNYIRLKGKIIEIKTTEKSRYTIAAPIIEYEYNGTKYNKFAVIQGSVSKYKVGDEVIVLYKNGLKGNWIRLDEEISNVKPIILIVFGIILLLGALFISIK